MNPAESKPYVGLRPFTSDEAVIFFGRRDQSVSLLQRLHESRFVAVVGSSGCGKSSLVAAGMIPMLRAGFLVGDRDRWEIAAMTPGGAPVARLTQSICEALQGKDTRAAEELGKRIETAGVAALHDYLEKHLSPRTNLLLLVDQFEEVFRFRDDGTAEPNVESRDFVALMLALSRRELPVFVAITMRSDFIGDCDVFEGLPEALNEAQYLVSRLTRDQVRQSIEGPARLFGRTITSRLSDRLVNDLGAQMDQLPVLQHALARLWVRTDEAELDTTDYNTIGGLKNAIAIHAEEAIEKLNYRDRRPTELLFRALTKSDANQRRVRRPTKFGELVKLTGTDKKKLKSIIQLFRDDGRLFLRLSDEDIGDDTIVDISHESLIRQWPRLKEWVSREEEDKGIYGDLHVAASRWKRGEGELLTGADLKRAATWWHIVNPEPHWAARYGGDRDVVEEFLVESELGERRREDEEERRQRERNTLIRWVVWVAALALGTTVLAFVGYYQNQQLADERDLVVAKSRELERSNNDLELANQRLEGSLAELDQLLEELRLSAQAAASATSPDGKYLASTDVQGVLSIFDLGVRESIELPPSCATQAVDVVSFSADGRYLAWAGGGILQVLAIGDWRCLLLEGHTGVVRSVAFNPAASLLASGSDDATCRLWDLEAGRLVQTLRGYDSAVVEVSFSQNGNRILGRSADGKVREWTSASGTFEEVGNEATTLAAAEVETTVVTHVSDSGLRFAARAYNSMLRQQGFSLPPVDVLAGPFPEQSQVRYFREEDRDAAEHLRGLIERAGGAAAVQLTQSGDDPPTHLEVWFGADGIGYWFPVVGTFSDEFNARALVDRLLTQDLPYPVQVYRAIQSKGREEVYAVTLGGHMTEERADARAQFARKVLEINDAYPTENRVWSEDLMTSRGSVQQQRVLPVASDS